MTAISPARSTRAVMSVETIRSHFPALERREAGQPVAYFDGPGGTQVPRAVGDAMTDYLFHHNANTHWEYPTSHETDAILGASRATLADFLNARADEISFGANMTTITFHLSRAIGRTLGAGDEIVVTELDHHANVAPWRRLAKERGVTIQSVTMRPGEGRLDWSDLERKITPRTKLVAIGAASNALGTINDVRRASALARQVGALVFVDAVHFAPHELVDVQAFDCDFLACSAYKFYGPHIGVLFGKRALIEELDIARLDPAPQESPERMETGTQNHEGIAGAAAAVEFLARISGSEGSRRERLEQSFAALHQRGLALFERLWNGLGEMSAITRYGVSPSEPRTPTIGFVVRGVPSTEVARALAARGVFVSHGDFYATTVIERLGQTAEGIVRAGCACYTSESEIDRLLEGLRTIAKGR
jgi:cysteine desulfurase family protein (TIGR01976 family)